MEGTQNSQIDLIEKHFESQALKWKDLYQNFERVGDVVLSNRKDYSIFFLQKYSKNRNVY